MAEPCTWAITGTGCASTAASTSSTRRACSEATPSVRAPSSSSRSEPAQKSGPAPARITARISVFEARSRKTSRSSEIIASVRAFRRPARSMTTRATAGSSCHLTRTSATAPPSEAASGSTERSELLQRVEDLFVRRVVRHITIPMRVSDRARRVDHEGPGHLEDVLVAEAGLHLRKHGRPRPLQVHLRPEHLAERTAAQPVRPVGSTARVGQAREPVEVLVLTEPRRPLRRPQADERHLRSELLEPSVIAAQLQRVL